MKQQARWIGIVLVLTAAILWGVGGTVAQRLFQVENISVDWLVSVRLLIAGLLLILLSLFTKDKAACWQIWTDREAVKKLLIFALFGTLAVQYTYMASIQLGNAAVATLLQYLAPVFIIIYLVLTKASKLQRREVLAVTFAVTGTFLLLTNGSLNSLSVPFASMVWGIVSGIALAFYTLYAGQLISKWGSLNVTGWSMLIGGASLAIFKPPWAVDTSGWTIMTLLFLIFVIICGTMLAFWFFIESLKYLKPQETSILGSVEPLAAIVTSVLWLKVSFGFYQMVGSSLILLMIITLSAQKDEANLKEVS